MHGEPHRAVSGVSCGSICVKAFARKEEDLMPSVEKLWCGIDLTRNGLQELLDAESRINAEENFKEATKLVQQAELAWLELVL